MSVNRLNFGDLAPAPSASMTRTTHSKKPHVHRCVSGCVNNFGVRSVNQHAVGYGIAGEDMLRDLHLASTGGKARGWR